MAEKVNLQQKIQAYRQSNPKLKKLSDNQILSIMVKNGAITLTAEQKQSILANSKQKDSNTGLQVEKTAKTNPKKTIYLQSGRKVVYSRLADGRTVMQYFGADGTPIKPDYFKKVEGQISIAANGSSYTVTKNGKKRTLKAKNPTQGAVDQNLARLNNEEKRLNKTKKEQGLIGKGWDWVKNKTGIGDGSDKAQQQINAERKLLNQVKTGKISKKDFKNATGVEYTKENLEKFKRGELSQATAKINGYKEGQEMAADVVGDMVSGIAAVTIYTAAVAAAPFTGGASIAVGVAAATASGALIKAGVKALDTVGTDKKYTMKDFGHDLATGAFSGALAPITGGLGGAVGKTVATKLGIQAVKQVGKEVAEEVVETGVKQGLKTALTNPAGYEYVGGTLLKRGTAMAAEMATDGALGGAIDGGFRAGLDNNWDTEAMLDGTVEGGIGGAIMSPIIGGGFKTMGKGAQKVFGKDNAHINENNKVIRDDVVNDFLAGKVDDKYVAAVLRDVDDLEQAFQVAETHTKDKVKLAEAKNKILEKVNKNIADHGSIVLQNEIPASYFSVDPKSGVRYAIASQDDIFLVHAVPQGKEIKSLSYLIDVTNKKSDDAYLSLSLVNKNSSLFNDDALGFGIPVEYGIIPNNRSINVTSAGQGQASCIEKNFSVFVHHQSLENSPEHYVLLKNSLLKNLKNKGYDLTDKDYIALFNELKHKEYFNEITNDIKIGNKVLKADELRDALELSSVELSSKSMYGQGSNNEVTSIIDGIKAIFARVDNIDDVKPEIKQLAKDNGLDIVLLGKPTRLDVESNPKFQSELKSIEQAFKDGKINMIQRMQQRRKLRTKYEAAEIEKLRARTTAEQKKLIQNQEKIDNILSKFNPNREQKVVKELLNDKTLSYVEKFVSDDTPPSQLMRFLDVINRRDYDASALEQIIKKKQVIDDKLINTLEFKNLDRFKNITLKDFSSLSIEERKEFINAFISIKYNEGHLKDLPDIAIFDEIKNLEKPQMPSPTATPTEKKEYLANKKAFSNKIADFYSNTLNKMLETIPRTKNDVPVSTNRLNPNVNLVTKPALTTDVSKIATEKVNINGHNVKVGQVKEDGTYFLHNLEDESIPKLEAYLLTDPDAILCTGFVGGKGMIKSSGNRPGIIVSPKNSMEDLLITAKEDVSSGFGAIKNYFNIQNLFLNKENEYNNYIPKLLKEKLNLSAEEYNVRLDKLKNLTHIDDIETVDKEFYNAIKTVISENPIFESIMRPNIEAIYLPKGMKISENVASFAERYDVPILFKDATDVPKTAPSANLYASKVQITETPIQTQQRLIKELEIAKSREDFSRITQEIKNLPKTEEYKAVRQRLGGEYLQRYNEWKADLPESTRSIVNLATDENGGITNFDKDFNTYVLRLTKGDTNKFKNILLKHPNYSKEYLSDILKLKNSDGKFICENLLDLDLYLKAYDNNPKFAHKLTRLKNENDEYKYNAQDIEWFTDSKNLEVKNFLKDSYGTNYNEAIGNQLEQLVKNDNDKFVLLKLLTDNDRYTIEEIMDIIPYTNNDNFEVIINNKGLEPKLFIDTLVEKDIQNVNNMFGNLFNQSERKEIKSLLLKNPAKLNDLVEMVETKNSTTTEIIKNIKSNDFQINKNAQQVQTELKKIGISDDEIAALDLESPMFQLVNQRNVERLQKLTGSEDLEKILALLSSSDSKVILDKLYLFEEQNVKLNLDDIMSSVYAPECITKITTEQIKAYKKLSDSLAVNFDISNCGEIQNPKNITNEFVNAFSEKYKKLQQYGVNLDLDVDPQIIFNSIDDTLINDLKMTTELGLSFKTSQISKDSLMQAISSFKGKEYKNGSLEKLYNMDKRDKDIIKELLCIKDKNGNQRFTIADIDNIMANHTGMLSSFRTLAKQETNHEYRFNNQQLAQLMQFRHDDIMDALIKDTEVINGCTTYKYSSSEIESILTKRRQFPAFKYDRFLDELLQKKYAGKSINKIFDFILSDNKHFDIVKSLDEFCLKSKDFDLSNITELIKEKENEKQLNNLLNVAFDKKFRFDIESITLFIKNKNNKITDKILNDYPRFSLDEMKEFLRTARQDSLEEYYIFNTNLDAKTIKEYCNYIYTKHLSDNTMIKNIIQLGKNPIEFAETMPKLLYQFKAKNKYQERMVYDLIEKGKNQQEIMYIANKIQTQDDYNKVVSLMKNNDDTWQIIRILNGQSPYKKTNIDFKGYPQTLAEISKIIDTDGKISYESKVLMELKETNPSRYKKIIDSGLLDLIKEKRVSSNIVCSSNKYGRILSDNVLNDIIKIKNNVPLVTTIKNSKEFNDISKHVKNGDVCEYNGRLFANDNGKPVELKLTKEKFEELFPLLSTNMASQGYIGDCWLVSTLFGCMDKPKSRIELYKLFEQDGNDILIRFPNKKESIRFPNGDPKVNSDNPFVKGVSSYGDKPPIGLQLLEKAFTVNRSIEFKDKISSNMSNLADENALMKSILEGGEHSEALDGLFSNNTVTFERYPMNDPLNSVSKILNILQHTAEDDYILYFDTPSKSFSDAKHVKNYDMCYKHAHCIKAFDENTGTVYITNPHEGGTISKVPFFEFINYIDGITLAKFK